MLQGAVSYFWGVSVKVSSGKRALVGAVSGLRIWKFLGLSPGMWGFGLGVSRLSRASGFRGEFLNVGCRALNPKHP